MYIILYTTRVGFPPRGLLRAAEKGGNDCGRALP